MQKNRTDLLIEVADYYSSKLAQHGETARGVDWNDEKSQTLRFEQLSKIVNTQNTFSVNDLGCGYGALFDFLRNNYRSFTYFGIDVSMDMIQVARKRYQDKAEAQFVVSAKPDHIADYGVTSGIFNVRLNRSTEEWRSYLEATLDTLDQTSRFGFAFNCLTSYSDAEKRRENLYYADPCLLFDLCRLRYSRNVALLHDYGLYEFTILVRKKS